MFYFKQIKILYNTIRSRNIIRTSISTDTIKNNCMFLRSTELDPFLEANKKTNASVPIHRTFIICDETNGSIRMCDIENFEYPNIIVERTNISSLLGRSAYSWSLYGSYLNSIQIESLVQTEFMLNVHSIQKWTQYISNKLNRLWAECGMIEYYYWKSCYRMYQIVQVV